MFMIVEGRMKARLFKLYATVAAAAMFCSALALSACAGETEKEENNVSGRWNIGDFVAQNEEAKNIYHSIYDGLSRKTESASAYAATVAQNTDKDDVLALLDNYYANGGIDIVSLINTYIADIYSYSQIQLSLIDEYESEALVGTYNVDYSNVDWGANLEVVDQIDIQLKNMLLFLSSVKPVVAQFVGVNSKTDKAYIAQTHELGRDNSEAKLEYFYDEQTNEMGVTTLNWHYSRDTGEFTGFEYHYCDAGNNVVITARGTMDANSQLTLTSATIYTKRGVFSNWKEDDKQLVFGYVLSEVERIEEEMDRLSKRNADLVDSAGNFEVPEEPRSVTVNYDYEILRSMIKI